MRAREFTINIPINIKINSDGEPEIDMPGQQTDADNAPELDQNPVMVSPLQQELELAKAGQGKESPVIDKMTQNDTIGDENKSADDSLLQAIKQLIAR
jgi:hypothetical protein